MKNLKFSQFFFTFLTLLIIYSLLADLSSHYPMEASDPPKDSKALNPEKQKQVYQMIQNHLGIIFNAPCTKFHDYPFTWKENENSVSITAIIEHFEEEQQQALVDRCNMKLRRSNFSISRIIWASECLKARSLRRHGGGIQFKLRSDVSDQAFMEILKESDKADLWGHVKSLTDFVDTCQIRFHVKPFGETYAKVVSFKAYHGVPIVIMMWLLRQLEGNISNDHYGFGQVIVMQRNGLPDAGSNDYKLHYGSGLIRWE